jgi:hypothetical protein
VFLLLGVYFRSVFDGVQIIKSTMASMRNSTMRQKSNKTASQVISSALQAQMAQATPTPVLKRQLLPQEDELVPAFEWHYEKLKALPRRTRRALQRYWKRSLGGVALLLTVGQAPALASTINVGGPCTLVRAINSANNDTAAGGCARGRGPDTIVLPVDGTNTLSAVNNTNYGRTGLPVIRGAITIAGNNSTIRRRSDAPPFRLFAVARTGNLSLQRTTLSGGIAFGGYPNNQGSAIFNLGNITLIGSTISGNSADDDAASLENYEGTLAIRKSTISGNNGYGVSSFLGTVDLTNSTVSGNSSFGVVATFGQLTVMNSTISGNAKGVSGANTSIELTESTITGNSSDGVEALYATDVTLNRSLVSGNAASETVEPRDNNVTIRQTREVFRDASSYIHADNYNLFGQNSDANVGGFSPGVTDIVPEQAIGFMIKTTLANNGGPTLTHELLPGCPAIDAVTNGTCPPPGHDQRGIVRPQDGNGDGGPACDIGSFERRPAVLQ